MQQVQKQFANCEVFTQPLANDPLTDFTHEVLFPGFQKKLDSSIDYLEFTIGYCDGWDKNPDDKLIGDRDRGNVPADYSIGFLKGVKDRKAGIGVRIGRTFAPYNEAVLERGAETVPALYLAEGGI